MAGACGVKQRAVSVGQERCLCSQSVSRESRVAEVRREHSVAVGVSGVREDASVGERPRWCFLRGPRMVWARAGA